MDNSSIRAVRREHYAPQVVFLDGLWGCGKTMLSPIVASMDRVELMSYLYELEYTVALAHLERMSADAAETMVRMLTDLKLYDQMMGRQVNCRPTDLSSIFSDINPQKYLKRMSDKGDEFTPDRIEKEQPILHLATHNILPFSDVVFSALGERAKIIDVVRHPLYMVKQIALNFEGLIGGARDLTIYFDYKEKNYPYYVRGWEEEFDQADTMEKAVLYMEKLTAMCETRREQEGVLVVPFEPFVLNPNPWMEKISTFLKSGVNNFTEQMLIRQRVPREKTVSGIDLDIYRRCGWTPSNEELSEREELNLRYEFVKNQVGSEYLQRLEKLIDRYESTYWKPEA